MINCFSPKVKSKILISIQFRTNNVTFCNNFSKTLKFSPKMPLYNISVFNTKITFFFIKLATRKETMDADQWKQLRKLQFFS